MQKNTLALLLLMLAPLYSAYGQSEQGSHSFTFKGNSLGMSLEEFRKLNQQEVQIPTTGRERKRDKAKFRSIILPLCTDQYEFHELIKSYDFSYYPLEAPITPPQQHEVICLTTSGVSQFTTDSKAREIPGLNPEGRTVAGEKAVNLHYRFFDGRLYRIHMWFSSCLMPEVLATFQQKYGSPTTTTTEDFGNAYGATWHAGVYQWKQDSQIITLKLGSGFGPGQESCHFNGSANVDFVDSAIAQQIPQANPGKMDF